MQNLTVMKKTIFHLLLLSIILFFTDPLFSQNQSGAFTVTGAGYSTAVVTDYQCVGLNPANLGWKRNAHFVNVGFGESSFSIYSEPLKRAFVNELFNSDKVFTEQEKQEAVENFTNTKLQFEGNISGVGISFQDEKIGGFGFTVRERLMWDSNLNEESADILFNGYNAAYFDSLAIEGTDTTGFALNPEKVTQLFEDTRLEMAWFREFNFSYGRLIIKRDKFSIYGGIGFKYIQGYSVFNYSYKDGVINAFSALNPLFDVDYDSYSPSRIENTDYQSIGNGWGLDFGLSVLLIDKLRISLALTDLGKIKWDGNVYQGEDAFLQNFESAGINNYNIFNLDESVAINNLKWGGWEGLENKTTDLPMNFRSGAAFTLNDIFEFGTEFYVPINDVPGSYDKLIFGLGTRISPVKWFRGSIGMVTGGETGTNIPMGISFFPFNNESFSWEIGLAVRDITSFFSQDNPTVSLAFGFLRFSFGELKKKVEPEGTENQ
jgi:hypothetical protein